MLEWLVRFLSFRRPPCCFLGTACSRGVMFSFRVSCLLEQLRVFCNTQTVPRLENPLQIRVCRFLESSLLGVRRVRRHVSTSKSVQETSGRFGTFLCALDMLQTRLAKRIILEF